MTQTNAAICSICTNIMTNSGERQMCNLQCGHVFCRTCLHFIFNTKPQCPICRIPFTMNEIRPVYVDGLPITDEATIQMNEKLESSEIRNIALQQDIDCKNKLINDLRIQLQQAQNSITKSSDKPYTVSRPALIIDSPLLEGSRISISSATVCAACNVTRTLSMNDPHSQGSHSLPSVPANTSEVPDYGLMIYPLKTPSSRSFLKLHTSPIRDLSFHPNSEKITTVSADHHIKVSEIETLSIPSQYFCPTDLWCCSWIDDHCLASGGNSGWLYLADTRSPTISTSVQRKGPPLISIATLDAENLFTLSPAEGTIFDIRSSTFRKITGGGQSVKRCPHTPIVMILSRDSLGSALNFYFRGLGGEMTLTKTKKIMNNDRLTRPSIVAIEYGSSASYSIAGAEIFFSCGDCSQKKRGFSLFDFGKIDVDLWEEPSTAFPLHPSPIIDTSLAESDTLVIGTISETCIKVFTM